jgi:pimeloyl-ACP methyl ester carboxylesterase
MITATGTHQLDRPEGRLAYDLHGEGPLVVTSPGMGDVRSTYREYSSLLVAAGFRVADVDLRGHGDSDASFSSYGDEATATDLVALLEALLAGSGEKAVIAGNSLSAASAVIAATRRPDLVRGLVLLGPFVRDPAISAVSRLAFRAMTAAPCAGAVWARYLPTLFAGRRPEGFAEHLAEVRASFRRTGHARAFSRTTRTSHAEAERLLPTIGVPALVLMGTLDPDFPDPAAEAAWIAERSGAEVVLVDDAGHYPQFQQPRVSADATIGFLRRLGQGGPNA